MELMDWRYAGQKYIVEITADLDRGWRFLEKKGSKREYWGFDRQIHLPDKTDPEFWCHLYVVAIGPIKWKSVRTFPGTSCRCELGCNSVLVEGPLMVVVIPLLNAWRPTNESGRERIYEKSESLFSITTLDGVIRYRVQLWFVNLGQRRMLVRSEYEKGDGVALVGGRPESNRRKF